MKKLVMLFAVVVFGFLPSLTRAADNEAAQSLNILADREYGGMLSNKCNCETMNLKLKVEFTSADGKSGTGEMTLDPRASFESMCTGKHDVIFRLLDNGKLQVNYWTNCRSLFRDAPKKEYSYNFVIKEGGSILQSEFGGTLRAIQTR